MSYRSSNGLDEYIVLDCLSNKFNRVCNIEEFDKKFDGSMIGRIKQEPGGEYNGHSVAILRRASP
ncbi:MAG: hypothetical protein V5A47_07915 [Bacteroidales bacterium]